MPARTNLYGKGYSDNDGSRPRNASIATVAGQGKIHRTIFNFGGEPLTQGQGNPSIPETEDDFDMNELLYGPGGKAREFARPR